MTVKTADRKGLPTDVPSVRVFLDTAADPPTSFQSLCRLRSKLARESAGENHSSDRRVAELFPEMTT